MHLRIEVISEKILVGMKAEMSFSNNTTVALWQRFMPICKKISDPIEVKLYTAEVYPPQFFEVFDPGAKFEKWAAIEIKNIGNLPDSVQTLIVPAGAYAVFLHKGPASDGPITYRYIFEEWLPRSGFELDDRPHFAVMGERYKNNAPGSEEEIWIPVRMV